MPCIYDNHHCSPHNEEHPFSASYVSHNKRDAERKHEIQSNASNNEIERGRLAEHELNGTSSPTTRGFTIVLRVFDSTMNKAFADVGGDLSLVHEGVARFSVFN